jgi:hypothetical protein
MREPQVLRAVFTLKARQAPSYASVHGPLQARVRSHPTSATVRVRPECRKRRQDSCPAKRARRGPKQKLIRAWRAAPQARRLPYQYRSGARPTSIKVAGGRTRISQRQAKTPAGQLGQRWFAYRRIKRRRSDSSRR